MRSHWFSKLSTALLLVLFAAIWVAFAPTQFGGQAGYVIVNGNSMEPLYHRGDLVIIRTQPDYQIGDIVTYRHPQIGPVIHRIIGRAVERFVFKGDHNNFIDPYHPVRSELIGKAWIYIPSAGKAIEQLRTPLNMAILVAVMGVLIMAPILSDTSEPRKRKPGQHKGEQPLSLPHPQGSRDGIFLTLAVLIVASVALAGFSFTLPTTRDVNDELTYQQTGAFSYSAIAPDGVYDSTTIQTGEPLFFQLTNAATVQFDYRLDADKSSELHGTSRLVAEIGAANGWRRMIELQPETAFSGSTSRASGVLDLVQLQALINHFEQQTGLLHEQYTLTLVPEVHINGMLAGQPFRETYTPRLEFRLDQTQIQLPQERSSVLNPLKPVQDGLFKATHTAPNVITLLFLKLEVPIARGIALGILAIVCVIGYLFGLKSLLSSDRPDPSAWIQSNYKAFLINVAGCDPQPGEQMVEVTGIDDLVKLAEKSGRMILHTHSGTTHRYSIYEDRMCYYYQCADAEQHVIGLPQQHPMVAAQAPAAWQSVFLDTLRKHGTISEACRIANIGIATAYEERMRAPAFAQAWTQARMSLRESLARKVDFK